jgi:hypothetical protein
MDLYIRARVSMLAVLLLVVFPVWQPAAWASETRWDGLPEEVAMIQDLLAAGMPPGSTKSVLQIFRHYCQMHENKCRSSFEKESETEEREERKKEFLEWGNQKSKCYETSATGSAQSAGLERDTETGVWVQVWMQDSGDHVPLGNAHDAAEGGTNSTDTAELEWTAMNSDQPVQQNIDGKAHDDSKRVGHHQGSAECGVGVQALEKRGKVNCLTSIEEIIAEANQQPTTTGARNKHVCIKLERSCLDGGTSGGEECAALDVLEENIPKFKSRLLSVSLRHSALGDCALARLLQALLRARSESWAHSQIRVQELDLAHTGLTAAGIRSLCAALPSLPSLSRLSLAGNLLQDEAMRDLAACISALGGTRLRYLDLQGIGMREEGARELSRALPVMKLLDSLDLSHNPISDHGMASIGHGLAVCVTQPCRTTRCLVARDVGLSTAGLCGSPNCRGTGVGARGLHAARPLFEGPVFVNVLVQLRRLEMLDLSWNHLGDAGVTALSLALQYPVPVVPSAHEPEPEPEPQGIRSQSNGSVLSHLVLDACQIGDDGLRHVTRLVAKLGLVSLSLVDNHVSLEGGKILEEALQSLQLRTLLILRLSANALGDAGCSALRRALNAIQHTALHLECD